MKKDNGITLIALIVTIIIMIILATIVVDFSTKAIDKAKLEDIKTNMLLIQGKSQTIYEKYLFKEIEELTGILYSEQNTYVISDGLLDHLKVEDDIYIWGEEALNENGLGTIKTDEQTFYIVDYTTSEIYFSKGYEYNDSIYYSLTELQELSI
ncbi:MAG: hypothetical protein ACI4VE_02295 [Clostridia bacterium]